MVIKTKSECAVSQTHGRTSWATPGGGARLAPPWLRPSALRGPRRLASKELFLPFKIRIKVPNRDYCLFCG